MTAYTLLIISFLLAIFGTFYKSTNTDEKGNTIYTKRGFPSLTRVGKGIITLLTLSFLISLYITIDNEKQAKEKEKKIQDQNALLQKEIVRTLHPIKDIQLAFDIRMPLAGPGIGGYRKRLEDEFPLESDEESFITSDLAPSNLPKSQEVLPIYYFNHATIEIEIFKAPAEKADGSDLKFSIHCGLDPSRSSPEAQECAGKMKLRYERVKNSTGSLRLVSSHVRADSANWRSTGRIIAISDLAGAIIVVRFNPGVAPDIQRLFEIGLIDLKISGRTFTFKGEQLERRQDKDRFIVYISRFPQTME